MSLSILLYIYPSFPSCVYLPEEDLLLVKTTLIKLKGPAIPVCRYSLQLSIALEFNGGEYFSCL